MENQTDVDFVSDMQLINRSDSSEAKTVFDYSVEDENDAVGLEVKGIRDFPTITKGGNSLGSSNLFGSVNCIELNDDEILKEGVSRVGANKSTGSIKSMIKEVAWSSFDANSVQNDDNEFASYPEFCSVLGDDFKELSLKSEGMGKVENLGFDERCQTVTEIAGNILNTDQYLKNIYPGWKYNENTGQLCEVSDCEPTSGTGGNRDATSVSEKVVASHGKTEMNHLQQNIRSSTEKMVYASTTESLSSRNHVPQRNNSGYPEHMYFDPQYPGWYFDMAVQKWHMLDSHISIVPIALADGHQFDSGISYSQNTNAIHGKQGKKTDRLVSQCHNNQTEIGDWIEPHGSHSVQVPNMCHAEIDGGSASESIFHAGQALQNSFGLITSINNKTDQPNPFAPSGTVPSYYDHMSQGHIKANGYVAPQNFVSMDNFNQVFHNGNMNLNEQANSLNNFHACPRSFSQQNSQSKQQFYFSANAARSAGRPPHALVAFGFGGKLIVLKDNKIARNSSFGSQDPVRGSLSVLNLMEVASESSNNDSCSSSVGGVNCNYFYALCERSFPGPLVGGSPGSKELNKWIDEKVGNCEALHKGQVLKLLLSLLKLACQHYGKLRSPFGSETLFRESNASEAAVAKLFASTKKNDIQFDNCAISRGCLRSFPSQQKMQETALEVQSLLVSGRRAEALQCAQEGKLWGPALVLASQLGQQFYADAVKQMALQQLVAGSPLRTLYLLIAGQPADIFFMDTTSNTGFGGPVIMHQQPAQFKPDVMLDAWEENLAIITANRTKDDELVIMHLGDCLWKDRSEVTAAHICYLLAESKLETYSDSARLCLIGSDHWKHPRTYANPESIQRTELYEYAMVLGNSQHVLLPFQPYKLIYAYMLAEVGKVSDSAKYCQAVLKSLKNSRTLEVEILRQQALSLEERIRIYQQGGYATNLAPAKLVGKLLNFFDSTAHRVVGGLPPPAPPISEGNVLGDVHYDFVRVPTISTSQSTLAMSSLMPSALLEPMCEWAADGNRMIAHNRSVSEPDFGRSPRQVDSSSEKASSSVQSKVSGSGGTSRFGRFGFGSQLLQKTVGLVLGPRSDRQAKLGEKNKFHFDENLKRWIEEGANIPTEAEAVPPPPTATIFNNSTPCCNLKPASRSDQSFTDNSQTHTSSATPDHNLTILPPIPSGSNKFSARGQFGVRSRYVDTFNNGGDGSCVNLFQSPPVVKHTVSSNAKFFVPSPASSGSNSIHETAETVQNDATSFSQNLTSTCDTFQPPASPSLGGAEDRYACLDGLRNGGMENGNGPVMSLSRRTASWGGSIPPKMVEMKPQIGEAPTFMPPTNQSFGDLHEVEL